MKFIDKFLNSITMYRLVMYGLGLMAIVAIVFGFIGILSYPGLELILSAAILLVTCNCVNFILCKIFKIPANTESASVTALILFFLLSPSFKLAGILTLVAAGTISMVSKYVLRIKHKHVFNPVAITAVILDLAGSGAVLWWIGSLVMLPFALVFGFLVIKKIRRFRLFFAFLFTSLAVMVAYSIPQKEALLDVFTQAMTSWPLIFFGAVMLTEPLTTPPTKRLQMIYGAIAGILFASQFKVGPFYSTPELALVLSNIFSYLVSSKQKLTLSFQSKTELAPNIFELAFEPNEKLLFSPGQYLEWTLDHPKPDNRGIRRYFTIVSSPTEDNLKLTIKASDPGSSFKKRLLEMKTGEKLYTSSLGGEFILPKDKKKKLVFIAGGIGLTPFHSMIKYLVDKNEKRDITFFYVCNGDKEFVYKNIFERAEKELGIKMVYVATNPQNCSEDWKGKCGYITAEMISEEVPDFGDRMFYLSGPDGMVQSYKRLLKSLSVGRKNIITDYFPGF